MVRTPASHAGNPGSNPGGITIYKIKGLDAKSKLFFMPIFFIPNAIPNTEDDYQRKNKKPALDYEIRF